jgi:hypothetical protein
MPTYDNQKFTAKCVALYSEILHKRLPKVKLMLDKGDAVQAAIEHKLFRRIGEYRKMVVQFAFDDHMDRDGNLDEPELAQAVAEGFSDPLIQAAEAELQAEKDNEFKRVGAGQLWVLHDTVPFNETNGKGQIAFEESDQVGMLGQTWWSEELKSHFTARATWTLLRQGEIQKEALNRLDPPPFLQAEQQS